MDSHFTIIESIAQGSITVTVATATTPMIITVAPIIIAITAIIGQSRAFLCSSLLQAVFAVPSIIATVIAKSRVATNL